MTNLLSKNLHGVQLIATLAMASAAIPADQSSSLLGQCIDVDAIVPSKGAYGWDDWTCGLLNMNSRRKFAGILALLRPQSWTQL